MGQKAKQPHGPPMTLGNMRELGLRNLIASCLNDACRHTALIDVSSYPGEVEVPSFQRRAVCGKCGGKRADVRPNWKEQPPTESLTGKQWRAEAHYQLEGTMADEDFSQNLLKGHRGRTSFLGVTAAREMFGKVYFSLVYNGTNSALVSRLACGILV